MAESNEHTIDVIAHGSELHERGIFGSQPNPEARFVVDHVKIAEYAKACRTLGLSIVLTSGSFDMVHVGHARYLERAKSYGDVLIVGIDSDRKVRERKGKDRPVVPEDERVQMLAHLRSVDLITLKYPEEAQWELIRQVAPDTLIVTEATYDEATIRQLEKICGRVIVLPAQATTSTSAQIRRLQTGWSSKITEPVEQLLAIHSVSEEFKAALREILATRGRHD